MRGDRIPPNRLMYETAAVWPCGLAGACPTAVAVTAVRLDALSTALGS